MTNVRRVLLGIDWAGLKAQKGWLARQEGGESRALLALLDAVQGAVVKDGLLAEGVVFPVLGEEAPPAGDWELVKKDLNGDVEVWAYADEGEAREMGQWLEVHFVGVSCEVRRRGGK